MPLERLTWIKAIAVRSRLDPASTNDVFAQRNKAEENVMLKMALIVWIMAGTVLAGLTLLVVLLVPSLSDQAMTLMAPLVAAAFVVAFPVALLVAKRMQNTFAHR